MRTSEKDKPPRLRMYWSKCEKAIVYHHDGERNGLVARGADARLLYYTIGTKLVELDEKNLLELLEERGYDLTTLRFSIRRKVQPKENSK